MIGTYKYEGRRPTHLKGRDAYPLSSCLLILTQAPLAAARHPDYVRRRQWRPRIFTTLSMGRGIRYKFSTCASQNIRILNLSYLQSTIDDDYGEQYLG